MGVWTMSFGLFVLAIPALWVAAYFVHRRVEVSRVWMLFDVAVGLVIVVALAIDGRINEGITIALIIVPILIMFSALRTMQMRYIDRKTKAIMDGTPAGREVGGDDED